MGWIHHHETWTFTKETRAYWDVFIALLFISHNIVRLPHVLTVRLASGVKALPTAPIGTIATLTLFWLSDRPSKVYAHRASGPQAINIRKDLGWTDHPCLKLVQFHQYHVAQVQDVELFDDHDVLRQSGGDGGMPPNDG